jgi:short-subunit dehydrogenase
MRQNIVLVTGASSGIGEATAKRYAKAGARVLLLARNLKRLEAVSHAIALAGGTSVPYEVDLSDPKGIEEVSNRITREQGTPRVIVNNAGAGRWISLLETTPGEVQRMIEVPYLAAFNLTRAFLPQMLVRGSGAVACVTSPASYVVWPNACGYIAARHALAGFTAGLRSELKGSGISVTLVVLGLVDSPYWEHNPGSRRNLPIVDSRLAPTLTCEEAAEAIYRAVEARRPVAVRPVMLRGLLLLNALAPRLVTSQLRRAARKAARQAPAKPRDQADV